VLGCFAVSDALNAFMFMSFSTTPAVSKAVLGPAGAPISDSELDWVYSISLALVVVMLLPAAHALDHYNRATMLAAVCLNVGAAWLRYASVVWGSYSTALLSSAMLGIATSVVMPSFALIPQRWFPPNQRAFATSVNVQSNYLGWGLGTLIPLLVSSPHTMRSFMLAQAAFATLTLPLTLALYRAAPPPLVRPHRTTPPTIRPTDPPLLSLSPLELLSSPSTIDPPHTPWRPHDALCNYQFLLQAICYGGLAGISYSLPAFQATAFTDCMHPSLHFVSTHSMWVNFAFITSGVVVGLVAGATVSEPYEPLTIRIFALTAALALALLVTLTRPPLLIAIGDGPALLLLLTITLALAGGASLGFFSLGLRAAIRVGSPVPEVYTSGFTEMLSQLSAVIFTQTSICPVDFIACAAAACLIALVLPLFARFPRGDALTKPPPSERQPPMQPPPTQPPAEPPTQPPPTQPLTIVERR